LVAGQSCDVPEGRNESRRGGCSAYHAQVDGELIDVGVIPTGEAMNVVVVDEAVVMRWIIDA